MNPFFNTPEKIAALSVVANAWRGTPFMPNAAVKGAGVSCQKLVAAIYIETGVWPADKHIPEGPMDWSHAHKESLVEKFMAEQTEFVLVPPAQSPAPGDMLGIQIGGCIHHCGLLLTVGGRFIHCMRDGLGVQVGCTRDATYLQRIKKVWRPVAPATLSTLNPQPSTRP